MEATQFLAIQTETYKLGFIGAGKMAESIAKGAAQSGFLPAPRISTSIHSNPARRVAFESFGVKVLPQNRNVVEESDVVIFSVKPQVVRDVVLELRPLLTKDKLLVSIAAGTKLKDLQEWAGHSRFIRVVPNTPSAVGEAASVMCLGGAASEEDGELEAKLFGSVGKIWRADEKLFDAIVGLSGSGPAYIYLAIEALADGGVAAGLPRELAMGLASQTVLGAASMASKTGKHPGQLKDDVASPGGTTSSIRRRKPIEPSNTSVQKEEEEEEEEDEEEEDHSKNKHRKKSDKKSKPKWSCLDNCCWIVGYICVTWWTLLFLYNVMPASLPLYVTEAITGPLPDPPGVKLRKEGLRAKHPVVFVPGIVTAGLELWEGHQCADGLFRKRLWGGTFGEVYKRPLCWVEHMSLDNETGLDPPGIRVRPVCGLVAADYFAPGYFVWAVLIANLAHIGYEEKTMYMASYDWRLSFQNTEVRDQTLSRIKSNIELMVEANGGNKAVIIPHSMGVLYFLHFMKWVEAPTPMGGGGGPDWCAKHIKAVMNIGGPFLGVPKAVAGLFSAEAKDIAVARAIAPGVLNNGFQTLQHIMRMSRTWDSTMSMIPKGGDTIWGDLDWSPEEGYTPMKSKQRNTDTQKASQDDPETEISQTKRANYGRIISFGKDVAEALSSDIERIDFRDAVKGQSVANNTCRDVWTEYHDMGFGGIKAVAEYKVYTAESMIDLLRFVAPKMMERGSAHFSYGIADYLDDPKYQHYKYWSNPLETKLPNAPEMEIFSLYGVGVPTERAYVYKLSPSAECTIPFQIDTSADEHDEDSCLKGGVYSVDGDETVPVLSSGFMCAKGWRGKTRFNPSGSRTYIREYAHSPPANFLEGRGTQSGAHVDIMGNFALIEDVMRVAAGATGEELGGDQVYSDIFKWSEKINLQL